MPKYILCIGAHPDDVESSIGGSVALWRLSGHFVKIVSVTDGCRGHYLPQYTVDRQSLVDRRMREAAAAAAITGCSFESMGVPDGEVYVTHALTEAMVRLIRSFGPAGIGPDVVILNRPNDYHRDHRYAAQVVLDACYMLTVPAMCPDVPHLNHMPAFLYWQDDFTEGGAFRGDLVVPIDSSIETKIDMVCAHESQFFEWLPYNSGELDQLPSDSAERREWVGAKYRARAAKLRAKYGGDKFDGQYAEAFQLSEYGEQIEIATLMELLLQ